jgi:hypothetical protein
LLIWSNSLPVILELRKSAWKLAVWSRDVSASQRQLVSTLKTRNGQSTSQEIRIDTSDLVDNLPLMGISSSAIFLKDPIFFENKLYEFEFAFDEGVSTPSVLHRLVSIEDSFREVPNGLRGTINFGNDVGWFKFVIKYQLNNKIIEEPISFLVFPTKLDMLNDLNGINFSIDQIYPLWRFSFAQKTDQELQKEKKPHEKFPLLWLALFQSLRIELLNNVRIILSTPHSRLKTSIRSVSLDRLKGKLSPKLETSVANALHNSEIQKKFNLEIKKLSLNTQENQFVLMVLRDCRNALANFYLLAKRQNGSPENQKISNSFFNEIQDWISALDSRISNSMFFEVGRFRGMERESLVLHQKPGYAGVYRVWLQLKEYLTVFGHQSAISIKSISELYEVWCFLEIREILLSLGFVEVGNSTANLRLRGVEKELKDGLGAAFVFTRSDGLQVRLAHEPEFKKPASKLNSIYSWNAIQRPDIVLQVNFPDGEKIHWIFDAKYRIDNASDQKGKDLVPEDAINQMHRYRDALIQLDRNEHGQPILSRPFIGAFVLFPGWYSEEEQNSSSLNPYSEAIETVGIGAFPALPGHKNGWLRTFLSTQLNVSAHHQLAPDLQLAQRFVRIPPTGLELKRTGDLIFIATTGVSRRQDYLQSFIDGNARWYHTRSKTIEGGNISHAVMNDISHVVVLVPSSGNSVSARYLYQVKSVSIKNRNEISPDQSGTAVPSDSGDYWLFELGSSIKLSSTLTLSAEIHFRFGICSESQLPRVKSWEDISSRYSFLQ